MVSEPAYVRAFKEFTKARPTVDDVEPMEKEFYGEGDRACCILFGGWVELALDSAIKSALRPDLTTTLAAKLFDFDGPIGTFSAKADLAYALAVFGKMTNHDIELIRLLRNQFAHCRLPLRFETPVVRAVCAHLQVPDTGYRVSKLFFKTLFGAPEAMDSKQWTDKSHPETRFVTCCHSIVHGLLQFSYRTDRHGRQMTSSDLP